MSVTVSVVVPTRDRPAALAECLRALAAQIVAPREIVVVDDASLDGAAVARVVAGVPLARLVVGEGRGPAAARNRGARAAQGSVLCFTDDDCRPDPAWVAVLAGRIDAGAEVVAGPTRNGRRGDRCAAAAQTITNHLVEASLDPERGTVGFAPTSNLACLTALQQELPFDEDYPLAAGEDRDWCARLAAGGRAIAYEPTAGVAHHPDLSLRRFWRQQVRYGRGAHRFHSSTTVRPPLSFYVSLLTKAFRPGPTTGLLVALAQLATAVGLVSEALSSRRRRRRG